MFCQWNQKEGILKNKWINHRVVKWLNSSNSLHACINAFRFRYVKRKLSRTCLIWRKNCSRASNKHFWASHNTTFHVLCVWVLISVYMWLNTKIKSYKATMTVKKLGEWTFNRKISQIALKIFTFVFWRWMKVLWFWNVVSKWLQNSLFGQTNYLIK